MKWGGWVGGGWGAEADARGWLRPWDGGGGRALACSSKIRSRVSGADRAPDRLPTRFTHTPSTRPPAGPPFPARPAGVNSFADTNKVLAISRIMVAWQPVGMAMGAYDMAVR